MCALSTEDLSSQGNPNVSSQKLYYVCGPRRFFLQPHEQKGETI